MKSAKDVELSRLWQLAPDCAPEWDSVTAAHHNVLLQGPPHATEMAIALLQPLLREPIVWRRSGEALELQTDRCCTLIVQDVAALNADEQTRLRGWLDASLRPVQVVSTASSPLFSLVERGLFDEPLYYRLNVMLLCVEAGSGSAKASEGVPAVK